jgi:TonB family protein
VTDLLWNIAAYGVQLAALVLVALAATAGLGVRIPNHMLRFWQCVMAIALLLPLAQPWREAAATTPFVTSAATVFLTPREAFVATVESNWLQAIIPILALIALGIVARLGWLAFGLSRVRSLIASARREPAFDSLMTELNQSLGVNATLMVSERLEGPATVGVRNPIVLVPPSVHGMSAAVQRAIICHELLHVKRRDWLNTIAEEVWCAVLWFHPLARVIASRLSLSREMVVDEQTILFTRDRRAYAEALLAFSNPQPHVIGVTPFIGRRTLSQRIALIAEEGSMSRRRALLSATIALTASIGVSAAAIDRFPMSTGVQEAEQVYRPGPENGVTLPVVLKEVKPGYTAAAMEQKIQGSVWLKCVVGSSGAITGCEVSRSLDVEFGLDQAALAAASKWEFKPGQKDGKPVAVQITIELTFTLKK